MKNQDKNLSKIHVQGLPIAVSEMLRRHLPDAQLDSAVTDSDLVVCAGETSADVPTTQMAARPVLMLSQQRPEKLLPFLRRLRQALTTPALYTDAFMAGGYSIDPQERSLTTPGGEDIALTDRETDIILYLARHAPRAVSRDELLKNVWRYQDGIDTHTLETHVYRLRQKLDDNAELLVTTEEGYRLGPPLALPA